VAINKSRNTDIEHICFFLILYFLELTSLQRLHNDLEELMLGRPFGVKYCSKSPPISVKCFLTLTRRNTCKVEHFRWGDVHSKDILGVPRFQSLAMY
jgi:hypothetical protein